MRRDSPPLLVEILSKPDCHLCEEAKLLLREVQSVYPFTLREIDIRDNTALLTQFGEEIPVVFINGRKAFKYRIDAKQCLQRLRREQHRRAHEPESCVRHQTG
ncbi:MAG: glutaredoxin family protein [Candidatus Tectomicrobia bacterium]